MMLTNDYIEARWGGIGQGFAYTPPEESRRSDARLKAVWRSLSCIAESKVKAPLITEVHSTRALPALIKQSGEPPILVWDAGLGTLFSALSFPMPYKQPVSVVEALLRQITGVRYLLTGRLEEAAAQVTEAASLLNMTPIDRSYQAAVDAEDQFEVFLLTEMQERFALGHELAHYLKITDPDAFDAFTKLVLESAHTASPVNGPPTVMSELSGDFSYASTSILYDHDLDPYAWYFYEKNGPIRSSGPCNGWAEERSLALDALESGPALIKEEIICDLLAGLSVALDAHNRQNGWTASMAAACSRLALSNLETILGIDDWVSGRTLQAKTLQVSVTPRQRCMNVLLPQMLPNVLRAHAQGSKLQIGDVHSIMHLVEDRHEERLGAGLARMSRARPNAESSLLNSDDVLLRAGFLFLRPSADHRGVNRTAGEHKFELGNIFALPSVLGRYTTDPEFSAEIDKALRRHHRGDWGDGMYDEDCKKNDAGLYQEFKPPSPERDRKRTSLYSQYLICGESVLIITAKDRLETKILLSREY